MHDKLYIPETITAGFQNRSDTFTGKLAYVIYTDHKGKLRKETSWQGWRDQKIDPLKFDNTPQSGFMFNKGITRGGYDWFGERTTKVRVWDPRDFEFEITIGNLIAILMHSDVSKRDIVQPCVYAWSGTELVLLPVNSEEYQESAKHTAKQSMKFSAKDLKIGATYNIKQEAQQVVYLGRLDHYIETDAKGEKLRYGSYNGIRTMLKGKKHVWYNTTTNVIDFKEPSAVVASCAEESVHPDFAAYLDKYYTMHESQPIKGYTLAPRETSPYQHHYYSNDWVALSETEFVHFETKFEVLQHTRWNAYGSAQVDPKQRYAGYNTHVTATRVAKFDPASQVLDVSYETTRYYHNDENHKVPGLDVSDPRIKDLIGRIKARYDAEVDALYKVEIDKYLAATDQYYWYGFHDIDRQAREKIDPEFNACDKFVAIMADGKRCTNTRSIY